MRLLFVLTVSLFSTLAGAATEAELRERLEAAAARADRALEQGRGPITPRVEALPQPRSLPQVDVGALSRRYEQQAREQAAQILTPGGLLAFVSFAMPRASLERLVSDAETSNTVLVLRGLVDGDFAKTFQAVRELLGDRKVGWVLDSEAFKRFGVEATPSYVLLRPGAPHQQCDVGQCYGDADFLKLAGDVPVAYVLEHFEREPGYAGAVASVRRGRGAQ